MPGPHSSSMDVNLSDRNASHGAPRITSAESKRLLDERLQTYNADNSNNLIQRLWDRAGAQHHMQPPPRQHNGGQSHNRPDVA